MFRQFMRSFYPVRLNLVRPYCKVIAPDKKGFAEKSKTKEQKITQSLKASLPGITYVSVEDISGGCGAMYQVNIEATEFVGKSRINQHKLVTEALRDQIAEMHGIRINTTVPLQSEIKDKN